MAKTKPVFDTKKIRNRLLLLGITMGAPFVMAPRKGFEDHDASVSMDLTRTDNPHWKVNFHVREYLYDGKITASLEYPHEERSYKEKEWSNSISFSIDKHVKKIEADLKNRLLPNYEEYLKEAVRREAESKAYADNEQALKDKLYNEKYINYPYSGSYAYINDKYKFNGPTRLTVQGTQIDLQLGFMPAEKVLKILEFLQTLK